LARIPLWDDDAQKSVKVDARLWDPLRREIVKIPREKNADVFARTPSEMPDVEPEVVVHWLNIDPGVQTRGPKEKTLLVPVEKHATIDEEADGLPQLERYNAR
jgi:hypothetical protein